MKASKFNLIVDTQDGALLFNTLSKSLVKIDGKSKLKSSQELTDLGFFVNDDIDENKLVKYWLHKRQFSKELVIEILGTNNCNLRCEYCFAYYRRNKGGMSDDTLEKTKKWILERIEETRPKKVRLVFSGGEPTLKIKVIEEISIAVRKKYPKVDYSFGIITNGTTLSSTVITRLKKCGLAWAQITLDGPREVHDKRRPLYNRDISSYDLIYNNLVKYGSLLPALYLRVNIDYENATHIKELLKNLNALPKALKDKMYLQFARVIENKRSNSIAKNQRRIKEYNKSAAELEVDCYKMAKKMGLNLSISLENIFDPHGPCMFMSRNTFIITTQGDLHKCVGLVKAKGLSVGNVRKGMNQNTTIFSERGTAFLESKKCQGCPYLPVCYGGCRNLALLDTGDMWAENCPKEYFENCSLELIKVLYE